MRKKEDKKFLKLLGFCKDIDGDSLKLFDDGENLLVEYKGELYEVFVSYDRVPDDFFNQPVKSIPYIVLDGNVYSLSNFHTLED